MIIIKKARLPIKIWAERKDLVGYDDAIDQAINLANHPLTQKWVALMPDFHVGYGMPIGGVVAIKGGVIPNAVGVDIGCGMIAAQTNLASGQLNRELLERIRLKIHERIPVGFKHHKKRQYHPLLQKSSNNPIISSQLHAADHQIGTLGGGNHFIEIQVDERQNIWLMIHSGSRNLGKKVADYYNKIALGYTGKEPSLSTQELAYIPDDVVEYKQYLTAMEFCLQFAQANRRTMLDQTIAAFADSGIYLHTHRPVETHHNFAASERHYGETFLIHRKGAVRASGLLSIPGSMGTASYICTGLKPKESFNSCSHGAGRVIGRHEANKTFTHKQAVESMQHVVFHIRQGAYDELPMAYKDIDRIIKLQGDLVKPVHKLLPIAVAKG